MKTVSEFLSQLEGLPSSSKLKLEKKRFEAPVMCAISGVEIEEGVAVKNIITPSTNVPHEIFRYSSKYVSVDAARLFKWFIGGAVGNLFGTEGGAFKPLVGRSAALKSGRPCWVDVVKKLKPGQQTVCIFTNEFKRRLWVLADVGGVGPQWKVYLNTDDYQGVLTVDHENVLEQLDFLETLYGFGFNKMHMRTSLFDRKILKAGVGLSEIQRLENEINMMRGSSEFLLAIFIVQNPALTKQS